AHALQDARKTFRPGDVVGDLAGGKEIEERLVVDVEDDAGRALCVVQPAQPLLEAALGQGEVAFGVKETPSHGLDTPVRLLEARDELYAVAGRDRKSVV